MAVWMVCPSKRPPEEAAPIFAKWRERGYSIAVWRDAGDEWMMSELQVDMVWYEKYPGYAIACNRLIADMLSSDEACDWIVVAADDIEPDAAHSAEEIAAQCTRFFGLRPDLTWHESVSISKRMHTQDAWLSTFGVMQPTGHRWGDAQGAYIDRVAGSPWIGREFAKRMYGGKGPYWPEYTHMGVDEELQAVAVKMGVFWQRPDLIHFHKHWGLPQSDEKMGQRSRMPKFLEKANSPEEWARYKKIFAERRAAGFPGHEPI